MTTIHQRTLADGRTRYWVKWRLGGTRAGTPQSEPFDTHADAHTFKLHVEAAGHQWPENWIRRQGWAPGWVPGHGWVRTDEEDDEPEAEPVLFADYARDLVDSMTGIEERTRADYHRDLAIHLIPRFGQVNLRDPAQLTPKDVRTWINHLRTGVPDPTAPHRTSAPSRGRKKEPGWLRKPLSPKSIHNPHGLLFTVCEAAVREDPPLRPSNPASRTRLPRVDDGEGDHDMYFLTREEFALLRDSVAEDVRDMVEVFVRTGMRYTNSLPSRSATSPWPPPSGPTGNHSHGDTWTYGGRGNAAPTTPSGSVRPRPAARAGASRPPRASSTSCGHGWRARVRRSSCSPPTGGGPGGAAPPPTGAGGRCSHHTFRRGGRGRRASGECMRHPARQPLRVNPGTCQEETEE